MDDYDDQIGGGVQSLVKRWWFDLERGDKLAFFPPAVQPPGGTTLASVVPMDRVAGQKAYAEAEKPLAARKRSKLAS